MAGHFDDFRNATTGAPHPDLIEQWEPISQSVITGNPLPDSDRSVFFDYVSGTFTRAGVRWKDIQTSGRTTVRTLLTYDNHTSSDQGQIAGPFLSGSGNQAERTGYVVWSGENFRLSKYSGGGDTPIASASGQSATGSTTRYLEIIRDGSLIEVRSWLYGSPRPSTALIERTDDSPLTVAGYVGLSLLLYSYAQSAITETLKLHSIAVGTDGDPAPTGPIGTGTPFTEALAPYTDTALPQAAALVSGYAESVDPVLALAAPTALSQFIGQSQAATAALASSQAQLLSLITGMASPASAAVATSSGMTLGVVTGVSDDLVVALAPATVTGVGQALGAVIGQLKAIQAASSPAVTVPVELEAGTYITIAPAAGASRGLPLTERAGFAVSAAPASSASGFLSLGTATGQAITVEAATGFGEGQKLHLLTGVVIGSFNRSSIIDRSPRYGAVDRSPRYSIREVH